MQPVYSVLPQDTVVALGALASYATAAGQGVDVTLQACNERFCFVS